MRHRRFRSMLPLAILILPLVGSCGPGDSAETVSQTLQKIVVDPTGGSLPGFRTVRTFSEVYFASLAPGSSVMVRGGTYAEPVIVTARGSAAQPVTIAAIAGTTPVLTNSVMFQDASYVRVEGLTVTGAEHSGFIIRQNANHITVAASSVIRSGLGIWIGDGAGSGHTLTGNTLTDNKTHGIAIDVINVPASDPTYITGNIVNGNGIHGMEINGSGYVVEGNRVSGNGTLMSGTSGIHVFAKNAAQNAGDRNTIRYNIVTGQRETDGQDGNGIQIDQWCDDNVVAFNVSTGNDGAGIHLFDAASNLVVNNTTYGNMRDSGGKHAYRGEIVLASDVDRRVDRTRGNRVLNNIAVSTKTNVGAITVERTTTKNDNAIGPNMIFNTAGGDLYRWGATNTDSGSSIALRGVAPDLIEKPAFVDIGKPLDGGAALARAPSRAGIALDATRDLAAQTYVPGSVPTFGAYRFP